MADIKNKPQQFALERNTLKRPVKDNHKDKIEIEIGDAKKDDFKPQFKVMRWDNEVNFSLRAQEHPQATVETVGEKIIYKTPTYEVHQYEKPEAGEDGGFEFEWVLPAKPSTNVLEGTFRSKGLEFLYQGALSAQDILDGCVRPENVVGSYAVYHVSKAHNKVGGKEYKTGKAFHIYRPKAIDAAQNETWCDLNINQQTGVLTVTVPQQFLDTATYPVVVDPTFGYTSVGASTASWNHNYVRGSIGTISDSGTINSISVYTYRFSSGTGFFKGLLLDSGLTIAATGDPQISITQTVGWYASTFSAASISAGTYYAAGASPGDPNGIERYYDSGAGTNSIVDTSNSYTTPTNPTDASTSSDRVSIYMTYTGATTFTNLVLNPSFENNITDAWGGFGSATRTRDTTVSYSGGASLKVDSGGVNVDSGLEYAYNLTAGTYYLSAYVKTSGITGDANVVLRNRTNFAADIKLTVKAATQDWTRVTGQYTVTSTDNFDIVIGLGPYGSQSQGIAWFDAIQLTKDTGGHLSYFDGSLTDTANYDYAWTGTAHNSTSTRTGLALVETLEDNFDDNSLDATKWNNWGGVQVVEANSQVEITSSLAANYYGFEAQNRYSLVGSSFFAELVNAGNQALTSYKTILQCAKDASNTASITITGNNVVIEKLVGGSYTQLTSTAYNSSTHKYLRFRESGGTLYYEYSANGSSWSAFTSESAPFALYPIYPVMLVGTDSVEGSTTTAIWDNFNIEPTLTANPSRLLLLGIG